MADLLELFESLGRPVGDSAGTRFAVTRVAHDLRHLVGRDEVGFPAVLVDATDDSSQLMRVELEHLTVQPQVQCDVVFPDGERRSGSYTLIRCTGDDETQALFLRLLGSLLGDMSQTGDAAGLARTVLRLVDLFRALSTPPRKSVQGLWAEVFVIWQASHPIQLLEAWHVDPDDLYDFNDEAHRIEVKSSSQRYRVHSVALEQLYPPTGSIGIIASVVVERAGGGRTIEELVEQIAGRCSPRPDLQLKLRTIVTETLGTDWRLGARLRFDLEEAEDSYRMFRCEVVPRIARDAVPPGVRRVRYEVTLDDATPLQPAEVLALGGLVAAAAPP